MGGGGQLSVPKFEKEGGDRQKECLGDLKGSCHGYFGWGKGAYYVSCKEKRLLKIKYGFEDSISYVDLGLF